MLYKLFFASLLFIEITLTGCTPKDAEHIGEVYNSSLTSNVTKNWVSRVFSDQSCDHFKKELFDEAKKHASAASGAYVNGMRSIMDRAISDGCAK